MNDNYRDSYGFEYIQLVNKTSMKEVYSSPAYMRENCADVYDFDKIIERLQYYFDRVNDGIKQQLDSPKTSDEQKKTLKLLDKNDYLVRSTACVSPGICRQPIHWCKEAADFLK